MGRRRVRNLQFLKAGEIFAYEPNAERAAEAAKEYKIKTVPTFEAGLALAPDAVVISTPPNHHLEYALACARAKLPFFVEASVIIEPGFDELVKLTQAGAVGMPSSTMRFFEPIQKIKEVVDSGRLGNISNFVYIMGQYLPDWHPHEDITKFYVGRRETGGCREMVPFETEWLMWVFGKPKGLFCKKGKTSHLKADIDDTYAISLDFGKFWGHVMVDVVSRKAIRQIRITGDEGTLLWDWESETVSIFDAKTKEWSHLKEAPGFRAPGYLAKENMYIAEMEHFVKCVREKKNPAYSVRDDLFTLQLLNKCEASSDESKYVKL